MKTKKIKRPVCYFVGLLAFGLMLYSCLQDETDLDSQETTGKVIKGKNRELSIDAVSYTHLYANTAYTSLPSSSF